MRVMGKLKLAIVYGAICGGCDVSLVNTGEKLADVLEKYDIVYWGAAIDGKADMLEKLDKIDVAIYMGTVRTESNLKYAKLIRDKADLVVAYGACAVYGGIPGLGALMEPEEIMKIVSSTVTTESKEEIDLPEELKLPRILPTCTSLVEILDPDVMAPGCPPGPISNDGLLKVLIDYAAGKKPEGKIIFGEEQSLCHECPRKPKDLSKIVMPGIYRLHEIKLEEGKCFLEQGILCMGPATRAACDMPCIKNNMPCIGCMGPAPGVDDVGLKYLSAIASILLVDKEKELLEKGLARHLDKIVDPLGMFYRYTLPSSYITKLSIKRRKKRG